MSGKYINLSRRKGTNTFTLKGVSQTSSSLTGKNMGEKNNSRVQNK